MLQAKVITSKIICKKKSINTQCDHSKNSQAS